MPRAISRAPSPTATITVLASHYDGKELNSPNDVVVKSDGAIYFSDPTYGRKAHFGVPREPQLAFRGVYRVAPDGKTLTCWSTTSGSRTACASRSTRRCCSSTTPTSSTSAPST